MRSYSHRTLHSAFHLISQKLVLIENFDWPCFSTLLLYVSISNENVAFFFDILHQITWKYRLLYVLHMLRFICSLFICSWFVPVKHWISAIFAGKKYSIVSYILDKIGVNEKTFCGESKTDYWRDVLVLKFRKTKWRLLSLFLIVPKQISLSWLQLKEI